MYIVQVYVHNKFVCAGMVVVQNVAVERCCRPVAAVNAADAAVVAAAADRSW